MAVQGSNEGWKEEGGRLVRGRRRCYRVGPDWIYFICFHNYRSRAATSRYQLHLQLHLLPGVASTTPGYRGMAPGGGESGRTAERERKRERERVTPCGKRREDEGWKRRKGVIEEKRQRPRHSRIPKDEEEESNRRVNERERGDERRREVGWFRRGHGKSTVRRYRLTDVRLSVVKR